MMRSIDRLLASRLFLKVLSVLVAVLVWFYLASDRGTEVVRTVTVPLEFLNVPADMSVTSGVRDVDIQVSGTREDTLLKMDTIASQVDLKGLGPGSYRRPIQAILSSGLRLVEVSPPFVDLDLTRLVSRTLTVKVLVPEDLPPEYHLEEERVEPREVSVKGPEQMLASLDNVWVAPTVEQLLQEKELSLSGLGQARPHRRPLAPFGNPKDLGPRPGGPLPRVIPRPVVHHQNSGVGKFLPESFHHRGHAGPLVPAGDQHQDVGHGTCSSVSA